MNPIPVPLALKAELSFPVGPIQLPLRTALVMLAMAPLGLLIFLFPWPLTYQVGGTLLLLGAASAASRPNREGVWLGLWLFYRGLDRWL
ncbi:MAG: hypothetical protein ACREN8_12225, partial [Candidatus Dormibacteraceae bacterium]